MVYMMIGVVVILSTFRERRRWIRFVIGAVLRTLTTNNDAST